MLREAAINREHGDKWRIRENGGPNLDEMSARNAQSPQTSKSLSSPGSGTGELDH